jgi:hypothetical protein
MSVTPFDTMPAAEPTQCVIAGCQNPCVGLYTTYMDNFNTRCAEHAARCAARGCDNETCDPVELSSHQAYPDYCVQCLGSCFVEDGRPHRFERLRGHGGSFYDGGIVCETHPIRCHIPGCKDRCFAAAAVLERGPPAGVIAGGAMAAAYAAAVAAAAHAAPPM